MKHFTEQDIRNKISMPIAIELMRIAFQQLSSGGAIVPIRTVIDSHDHSGRALFMPSYSAAYGLFGLKMVAVFPHNTVNNLPMIQGKVMVMDGKNGTPLALLDAEYLTALRTGAASGLATDLLSRQDAEVMALFGTGAQAESQISGVLSARPVKEIMVFGKSNDKTISFCNRMSEKFGMIISSASSASDLRRADIICTATTSMTPVFQEDQLKEGVHINGIGSFKATMQEIPSDVILKSILIVDQRQAAMEEAGEIVIPIQQGLMTQDHIHAELGEIILGSKKGRTFADQITVFKSVGNAIQDLAIANYMLLLSPQSLPPR